MYEKCIGCNTSHEDFNWRRLTNGWICSLFFKPTHLEWIPDRIKESRNEYAKSILQPFRGGEVSSEYLETYGSKGINASESQIKKARPIWKDVLKDQWRNSK